MRGAWVIVAIASVGCGESGAAPATEGGVDARLDTTTGEDPDCHIDCFGGAFCSKGIVTVMKYGPAPCSVENCGIAATFECERGCRIDGAAVRSPFEDPKTACEEYRPKKAGDPCASNAECAPPARVGDAGRTYLACDVDAGRCAESAPPSIPDFGAPCVDPFGDASPHGPFILSDACSGRLCIVYPVEACVVSACTRACAGDWDCPLDLTCEGDWAEELPPDAGVEGALPPLGFCRPDAGWGDAGTCPSDADDAATDAVTADVDGG